MLGFRVKLVVVPDKEKLKRLFASSIFAVLFICSILVYYNGHYSGPRISHPIPEENDYVAFWQKDRLQNMKETCNKKSYRFLTNSADDKNQPQRHQFVVDDRYKLLYCWIHKVASTSWMALFAQLHDPKIQSKAFYRMTHLLAPTTDAEFRESLKKYFTFLIVRHPFDRLVSAYRDRINRNTYCYSAYKHGPAMLLLSRPFLTNEEIFKNNSRVLAIKPTFQEFLQYIVQSATYDDHWAPYYRRCSPCLVKYSAVFKLETISDDFRYFMTKTKLRNTNFKHLRVTNSSEVVKEYFSAIPRELKMKVYKKYRADFELFQYTPQEYL